jgi:hypothetical protein
MSYQPRHARTDDGDDDALGLFLPAAPGQNHGAIVDFAKVDVDTLVRQALLEAGRQLRGRSLD